MKKPTIKSLLDNDNKITENKLAKKVGISESMMHSVVTGTFGRLGVLKAIKIADYFGMEVEDIDWRPLK